MVSEARFPAGCSKCGGEIRRGELMEWAPGTPTAHADTSQCGTPVQNYSRAIRARINELTQNCRNQIDLDAAVSGGLLEKIRGEFPSARPVEILYEWDVRKLASPRMTRDG